MCEWGSPHRGVCDAPRRPVSSWFLLRTATGPGLSPPPASDVSYSNPLRGGWGRLCQPWGHEHLGAPQALSQHPINHGGFYSPGSTQEGAGPRFLAGTDGSFPSRPLPSFSHSSMQPAQPTWTKRELSSEAEEGEYQVWGGPPLPHPPLPLDSPGRSSYISSCIPQRFLLPARLKYFLHT